MNNIFTTLKLFLLFNITYGIVNSILFYQIKNVTPTLKNIAIYNLVLFPVYWIVNILSTKAYSFGELGFGHDIWKVNLIYLSTGIFSSILFTYLWLGKVPSGNNLIGMLIIFIGIVVANLP